MTDKFSDEDNRPYPAAAAKPGSVLEYLVGRPERPDRTILLSIIQEIQVAPELQDEVEHEVRLVWGASTPPAALDHDGALAYAREIGCQSAERIADGLREPGRIPRSALIATRWRAGGRYERAATGKGWLG